MPLHVGDNPTIPELVATLQAWVTQQEGINAAERLQELTGSIAGISTLRAGTILEWAGTNLPSGYLWCDGVAHSRVQYANLFAEIMTTYGAGDGVTTFNVPDRRGRFGLGKAASGTGATLGSTGGAIDHVHTGPSHTHTVSGSTANESAHTHTIAVDVGGVVTSRTETVDQNLDGLTQPGVLIENGIDTHTHGEENESTSAGSAHSHGAGTLAADAGGTGNTGTANPPFIALNYVIKT